MNINCILQKITGFHGRSASEEFFLVAFRAIILQYNFSVPIPEKLSLISQKKRKYSSNGWQVFTPLYKPEDTLYKQLDFALKYLGFNLLLLKKLFDNLENDRITELVQIEPLSQYSRKIWFIYEWLFNKQIRLLQFPFVSKSPKLFTKVYGFFFKNYNKTSAIGDWIYVKYFIFVKKSNS